MESLWPTPGELDTTLTPSVRASHWEITTQAAHTRFINGVLTATQDGACQWCFGTQGDSCRYEKYKQRGSSSLYVCVSHAELSKQTGGRLEPKYELERGWLMLVQLNVTLFPKPHKDKYTTHELHTHMRARAHTYSDPLKAIEQRVIIMRVNSRTPLGSSAGCVLLAPLVNGNTHTASCHCFKPHIIHFQCPTEVLA